MLRRGRRAHAHFPTLNTQGVFDSGTSTKHGGSRVLHMHIADFGAKRTSSCFSRLNVGPQARRTPALPAPARHHLLACSLARMPCTSYTSSLARMPGASSHAT